VLALAALGGYQSDAFPAPKNVASSGFFRADLEQIVPTLNLRWLLLDFGVGGTPWTQPKSACWQPTSASTASTRRSSSASNAPSLR